MTHVNFAVATLLNGLWQGTVLALTMWLFLKLFPRMNPTTRFTILWATLLAVVALLIAPLTPKAWGPSAFFVGPKGHSAVIASTSEPTATRLTPIKIEKPQFNLEKPTTRSQSQHATDPEFNSGKVAQAPSEIVDRQEAIGQGESIPGTVVERPLVRIHAGKMLETWEILSVVLSLLMLMRLALGYLKLRGLKGKASPLPEAWQMRLRALQSIHRVHRKTRLLVSGSISAPISLGFFSPAILVPERLVRTLSEEELEHVLLHELGHLRRYDDWTNLAQRVIEAVLPIQPAIYWIGRRMEIEREMACDDWVIARTGTAESYASALTRVAELSQWSHAGILAAGATGNRSQLFIRVHHMLDRTRNSAPRLMVAPLSAACVSIAMLTYLGVHAPRMIAFAQAATSESIRLDSISEGGSGVVGAARASATISVRGNRSTLPAPSIEMASLTSTIPAEEPVQLALVASPPSPRAPMEPSGLQENHESHMEMTTRNGSSSIRVKVDGAVEFTDDDQDVKMLSPGGHFRLEEGGWFSGHAYDVKADSAGNLTRTYSVGTSVKTLDAEGRAWLAHLMPEIIRESGVGAAARVARILGQGGPQAVIREIGLIHGDGSKRIYLEQLFSQATLNTEQLKTAARVIGGISSDGDKAEILMHVDEKYFHGEVRQNLFDAVESMHSDGDKRRVLSDILRKDAGNTDTLLDVTRAAKHISSDGDKAEVLIEMANAYRDNGGLGMAYFETVKSISSDGDHARVLLAVLAAHGDIRDTVMRVLISASKISSDGDKARVLKEAVSRYSEDEAISRAFIDAANSISSDGDHQQVLVTLVHRRGINATTVAEIAKSAQRISSDGDKARVLAELIGLNVEPARGEFFAATDTIHSDGDHSHVLITLLDRPGTSSAMAVAAIQSATHISSDGDKARVLMDAARRYPSDPQVDAAIRKAVESLHSDGDYRSVLSELNRHGQGS